VIGLVARNDGWRVPDATWERIVPLLPPRPWHPLGCHNPRVPDRDAFDPACVADGDAVEHVGRDRDLLVELGPPPLPGVGAGSRVLLKAQECA
jgi:hypothetical protein